MAILTRTLAVVAAVLLAGAAPKPGVEVTGAWIRATQPGAPAGAAYATLTNTGPAPDRLIGVATPAAGMAHLHQSVRKDGMASMKATPVLDLPAGRPTALAPGDYHIMLMGLTRPLAAGDRVPMTLTFETAGKKTVTFAVRNDAPSAPEHHH